MEPAWFQRLERPLNLGKLRMLAKLGEGGMATVYLASIGDGALARMCAVKLLRPGHVDAEYRTRFLDEARIVVRLHHNNLVDVREAGEIDRQLYIAMELVEGRDLADVWDRCAELGRAFPIPIAVHLVREVLRGLHYAHTFPSLSLVHRDVSPSNVLIDWAGAVRLADFGLATSTLKTTMTAPGVVFGKVGYMSPEQALREPLDARADVYGCGVVLWELVTGRPLRDGVDTQYVADQDVPPPASLSHRVDEDLDAIVNHALARERSKRYGSAHEFMAELSSWLTANAPSTGQEQVARFMAELFGDTHAREHAVVSAMVAELAESGRTRVFGHTLPDAVPEPTDRRSTHEDPTAPSPVPGVDGEAFEHIPAGTVIAERYRVLSRLGRGGMGTVYLGEHVTVGRSVAIKVLTYGWSRNDAVAGRFRAEARSASAAGHPNIVEVFDSGALPDGRLYLVMEFLTGRTLYEEVKDRGPLDVARACRIVRDVARAVRAAHAVGVIHRDLKPDNVMIVDRGEGESVKVLDFGISANAGPDDVRMTIPGHALGTPAYMAPEQAKGQRPTEAFDIYALGVILYETLLGQPPFDSENMIEVVTRKATERAPSLATSGTFPSALVRLVDECLEIAPERRPQTVEAFLQRIEKVLHGLPRPEPATDERAVVSIERPPRPRARWALLGASAGVVAVLVTTVVVAAWPPTSPERKPLELVDEATADTAAAPAAVVSAKAEVAEPVVPTKAAPAGDPPAPLPSPPTLATQPAVPVAAVTPAPFKKRPPVAAPAAVAKAWESEECKLIVRQVVDALDAGRADKALRLLERAECWSDRAAHRRAAVRAHKEAKQWDACVELGQGSTDSRVLKDVQVCAGRRGS